MKRLLLPLLAAIALPTAVNAFPWNKDIVVKTDLGEQYIIKDSAITVLNFGKDDILKKIEKGADKHARDFKRCEDGVLGYDSCDRIFKPDERKWMDNSRRNTLNKEGQNVHFVGIRFRPIFVDLNNQKSALDYDKVGCVNPKIKKETLKIWDYFTGIQKFKGKKSLDVYNAPDANSSLAYEQMRAKICTKYAKF